MHSIAENLAQIRASIASAEQKFNREPGSVRLMAVSKTQTFNAVSDAMAENQIDFGESYVQEAIDKIHQIGVSSAKWHFIGPIQSNKTRQIAENFSWVHSISRLKIAERLNKQRPDHLPPINICIQVDQGIEAGKSGVLFDDINAFVSQIEQFHRLKLRGLMLMPAMKETFDEQRQQFKELKNIYNELNSKGLNLDTLSMGTSHDMEAAIAEEATMIRIGTGIFGPRTDKNPISP